MLQELGVDFDAVSVDLTRREHCSPIFSSSTLPAKCRCSSTATSIAIVLYLAEKYPDRGFIAADLKLRADFCRWILFAVTELEQPWWRIAKHTQLYPEQDRLTADVALARRDFLPMAAVLEKHMKGRNFVVGARVTAADFVLAYTLHVADEMHLLGECPALRCYLERMYARPRAVRSHTSGTSVAFRGTSVVLTGDQQPECPRVRRRW
jgi:glutathione S-transferase